MTMETRFCFTEEEMEVDETLGYPKAYAKLCNDPHVNPYNLGPPFTFVPYALPPQELSRARELDQLFPVIELEAKTSAKLKLYANLLWKQLNHLGNAGFDPAKIRVDPYGNVLYYHADPASPLAWNVDHWFPCSRGGKTVSCNLRIMQWQVCEKKHNKLEFLVPWWDLQLGISVDQFLSIFASSNSDFRNRAFSFLFFDGENEELNDSQSVDSHVFPQHFVKRKERVGLAPAAIVLSRTESSDSSSVLRSVDLNSKSRARSSAADGSKLNESLHKSTQLFRPSTLKENDIPDTSPYLTMAMAKDSLRKREEVESEIQKLDMELDELNKKNEVERIALQDLESVLIKRRRRTEKSRRLAEAQSSYKALLEKMIRDAMHQSVIYKEQLRLNQAATSTLMARLEAQKATCDDSEKDLRRKFKQRDEIEKQVRPQCEQARKRSRLDEALNEEGESNAVLCLPEIKPRKPLQKELRVFLEEEHKASQDGSSPNEGLVQEEEEVKSPQTGVLKKKHWEYKSLNLVEDETSIEDKLQKLDIGEVKTRMKKSADSILESPEKEDEEYRKQRGKGNVDKWLQILLDDSKQASPVNSPHQVTNEDEKSSMNDIIEKVNLKNPQKEIRILKFPVSEEKAGFNQNGADIKKRADHATYVKTPVEKNNTSEVPNIDGKGVESCESFEGKGRSEKDKNLARSESARSFKAIPYSPSVIFGMRKGADCIGKKKPVTIGSDEEIDVDRRAANIIKSSIRTIKKVVKM